MPACSGFGVFQFSRPEPGVVKMPGLQYFSAVRGGREKIMEGLDWMKAFGAAVTVCDTEAVIIYMNEKSAKTFEKYGGASLAGKSLLDCHPEPARSKLVEMMRTGEKNSYTIEKNGVRKLIHQAPWYNNGEYMGFVEISIELPPGMPHYVRK
jgi:transcriptional regulator with PAS, ATPase and Fis domain